jgi:hypothetical protein
MIRAIVFVLLGVGMAGFAQNGQPDSACPTQNGSAPPTFADVALDDNATADTFAPLLLDYLNTQGSPAGLGTELDYAWPGRVTAQVMERDLTGDAVAEVIVQINRFTGATYNGAILVFRCAGGQYNGGVVRELNGWAVEFLDGSDAPAIRAVADLTGDRLPELVVSFISAFPAPAYERTFSILTPEGDEIGRAVAGFYGDGVVRDSDADGTFELVLTQPRLVRQDPYQWSRLDRDGETIVAWDGEAFAVACSRRVTPPVYRIQAVEDGENALGCGHYAQAVAFYRMAIEDNTLIGWSEADNYCPGCERAYAAEDSAGAEGYARQFDYPVPDPGERPYLAAFARYRLVMLYAALGDVAESEAQYDQLASEVGSPGAEFVEAAAIFREAFQADGDAGLACERVQAEAPEIESPFARYVFLSDRPPVNRTTDQCPFQQS